MSHLRIGISANFFYPDETRKAYAKKTLAFLEQGMCDFFASAGAIPYMIPKISGKVTTRDAVAEMDGIVFAGGADLCPRTYGEEPLKPEWEGDAARDDYEIALFHAARELKKPVLGICRGMQLMAVAHGGRLEQHLPEAVGSDLHQPYSGTYGWHEVSIAPDTVLSGVFGAVTREVATYHHQGVADPGSLRIAARAADGLIEALEDPSRPFVVGVQWHPEALNDQELFGHFVSHATARARL